VHRAGRSCRRGPDPLREIETPTTTESLHANAVERELDWLPRFEAAGKADTVKRPLNALP
jgi:hypothetical protein